MKIIFVNRFFYPDHSATSQLLSDLAFYLVKNGFEITVLASRQIYDDSTAELACREIVQGVEVIRVWTSRFGRRNLIGRAVDYLTFYLSALVRLIIETREGNIVVAKTDPPLISVIASRVARWKKAKLVNWVQDMFPEVAAELGVALLQGRLGRFAKNLRNRSLMAAEQNVVLGEHMKKRLLDVGVADERIHIIHNWSDESLVYPVEWRNNRLKNEWGLSDKFVVGYSGNMGRAHEFDAIIAAAELLRDREDILFLFVGGGAKRSWIEEQISARSLSNVILKPYQPREKLAESLSVPDIHFISLRPCLEGLIVPSKFYGIAAVGRPVLFEGSLDGEIARIIRDSECGISVELGDATDLAYAIKTLADDAGLCAKMGANAQAAFGRFFGSKRSLTAWRALLAGL